MCENDWFRKWIGGKSGNRAKEYEDLKKKWAEAVLYR